MLETMMDQMLMFEIRKLEKWKRWRSWSCFAKHSVSLEGEESSIAFVVQDRRLAEVRGQPRR